MLVSWMEKIASDLTILAIALKKMEISHCNGFTHNNNLYYLHKQRYNRYICSWS